MLGDAGVAHGLKHGILRYLTSQAQTRWGAPREFRQSCREASAATSMVRA
jgi:hypothetical protein